MMVKQPGSKAARPGRAITLRVPADLHRRARVLSVARGESLNAVLSDMLRQWVEHYERRPS